MLKILIHLTFIAATPLLAQQGPSVVKVEAASKSIFGHVHAILDQWDKIAQPSQLAATQKFTVAELKVLSKELKHLKKLKRPSQAERVKLAKTYEAQLLLLNRRWDSIEKKLQKKPQLNQAFLKDNHQLLKVLEAYNATLEQLVAQDLEQAK